MNAKKLLKALAAMPLVGLGLLAALALAWLLFYLFIFLDLGNLSRRSEEQKFVVAGLTQIQPAWEMNQLYSDCSHMLCDYDGNGHATWNAVAFFGGRYELTMQVPVEIYSSNSGKMIGDPQFMLLEVGSVDISSTGQIGASYLRGFRFGLTEWQSVVAAQGDFSVIGFQVKSKPVKDFGRFAAAMRR